VLHYFSDVKYKNEAVLAEAFRLTVNSLLHDKEPPVKVIYTKIDVKLPLLKCKTLPQFGGSGFNGSLDPHPDPDKYRIKFINFINLIAGCAVFRAENFSCSLDISNLQFLLKKKILKNQHIFFLQSLVIKTLDPDWIRIRIRIRIQIRIHSSALPVHGISWVGSVNHWNFSMKAHIISFLAAFTPETEIFLVLLFCADIET
jgi:hypothetical protein